MASSGPAILGLPEKTYRQRNQCKHDSRLLLVLGVVKSFFFVLGFSCVLCISMKPWQGNLLAFKERKISDLSVSRGIDKTLDSEQMESYSSHPKNTRR